MDHYSWLRELADSWVLLALFGFFLAVIAWVFRPGAAKEQADAAGIPLRNETLRDAPQDEDAAQQDQTETEGK